MRSYGSKRKIHWISEAGENAAASGSKAAYVSQSLLPVLASSANVVLYTPENDLPAALRDSCACHPIQAFHPPETDALVVYQLEDLPESFELLPKFESAPGIVWFHDWYLRHENSLSGSFLAQAEKAKACAFSSLRNAEEFRRSQGGRAHYLPYPCSAVSAVSDGKGSLAESFRIAYAGSPLVEDHFHLLMKAVTRVRPDASVSWMLSPEELGNGKALVREFPAADIKLVPGRSPSRWNAMLEQSDLAVHLHFSAYGDFGPYLAQSLLSSVPVMVSQFGDAANLDAEAVFFVEVGDSEQQQIEEILEKTKSPAELKAKGSRGRESGMEVHPANLVAAELLTLIESVRI